MRGQQEYSQDTVCLTRHTIAKTSKTQRPSTDPKNDAGPLGWDGYLEFLNG